MSALNREAITSPRRVGTGFSPSSRSGARTLRFTQGIGRLGLIPGPQAVVSNALSDTADNSPRRSIDSYSTWRCPILYKPCRNRDSFPPRHFGRRALSQALIILFIF